MLAAWPIPPRIIGISDAGGYLYDEQGLPIADLLEMGAATGQVTYPYFVQRLAERLGSSAKFAPAGLEVRSLGDWHRVLASYLFVDVAHKVVGVGSVGLRAFVRPNVVGRIDLAAGGEGLKVYVEIGYPY